MDSKVPPSIVASMPSTMWAPDRVMVLSPMAPLQEPADRAVLLADASWYSGAAAAVVTALTAVAPEAAEPGAGPVAGVAPAAAPPPSEGPHAASAPAMARPAPPRSMLRRRMAQGVPVSRAARGFTNEGRARVPGAADPLVPVAAPARETVPERGATPARRAGERGGSAEL